MPQVVSIQYLRGFAAMLVLIYHIGHIMPNTGVRFPMGTIGVDIFFVISGFIIWVTGRNLSPGQFLKRRLIRLVPLYWAVTFVMVSVSLFSGDGVDRAKLFYSLLFIAQSSDGAFVWPKPILTVGWTLNLEMLFYLCTAGALLAPPKARFPILATVLSGLVAIGFLLPEAADSRLIFYTTSLMAEFLIGVCLGVIWTTGRFPKFNALNILIFAFTIFLLTLMPLENADRLVAFGSFVTLLTLLFLMAEPVLSAHPIRLLHALGDTSYSLYLTHVPVIVACKSLAAAGYIPASGSSLAAITLIISLLVSFACHYGFERPVHVALSARLRRRKFSPTVQSDKMKAPLDPIAKPESVQAN